MVVNVHQHSGRRAVLPGVVAKRFAQGMAADISLNATVCRRFFYDAECLRAADAGVRGLLAGEDERVRIKMFQRVPVEF